MKPSRRSLPSSHVGSPLHRPDPAIGQPVASDRPALDYELFIEGVVHRILGARPPLSSGDEHTKSIPIRDAQIPKTLSPREAPIVALVDRVQSAVDSLHVSVDDMGQRLDKILPGGYAQPPTVSSGTDRSDGDGASLMACRLANIERGIQAAIERLHSLRANVEIA